MKTALSAFLLTLALGSNAFADSCDSAVRQIESMSVSYNKHEVLGVHRCGPATERLIGDTKSVVDACLVYYKETLPHALTPVTYSYLYLDLTQDVQVYLHKGCAKTAKDCIHADYLREVYWGWNGHANTPWYNQVTNNVRVLKNSNEKYTLEMSREKPWTFQRIQKPFGNERTYLRYKITCE